MIAFSINPYFCYNFTCIGLDATMFGNTVIFNFFNFFERIIILIKPIAGGDLIRAILQIPTVLGTCARTCCTAAHSHVRGVFTGNQEPVESYRIVGKS